MDSWERGAWPNGTSPKHAPANQHTTEFTNISLYSLFIWSVMKRFNNRLASDSMSALGYSFDGTYISDTKHNDTKPTSNIWPPFLWNMCQLCHPHTSQSHNKLDLHTLCILNAKLGFMQKYLTEIENADGIKIPWINLYGKKYISTVAEW